MTDSDSNEGESSPPTDEDPWALGGPSDEEKVDPIIAALDPASPGKNTATRPVETEPQIAVRSPEGTVLHADASQQKQYEEMGFEVVVGAEQFGANGTLTTQADPDWVEFGNAERKAAESRLKRR